MEQDALRRYRELCAALDAKPLGSPELVIDRPPGVVDVSRIYFPRKHLSVLVQLVAERSDLHTLILDEADLHTEDVEALVDALKGSHVTTLSLQKVKLHPRSGELLRQLCRGNSRITCMRLDGTMLPDHLLESILLVVDLNRIASETSRLEAMPSLQCEAPKQPKRLLEGWSNDADGLQITMPTRRARDVINEAMRSVAQHYIDADFSFGQQLLGREDIEYYRVLELSDMLNVPLCDCCVGASPVEASEIYNNRHLCAAINVLQQNSFLQKGVVSHSVPEFGLYGFRFFVEEEEVEILVDDVIPCLVTDGVAVPIGIHNAKTDYWGPLVEKAFAKLVGGYENIPNVSFGEALTILTGGSCLKVDWMKMMPKGSDVLFELLRDLSIRKNTVVSCALPDTTQAKKALQRIGIIPLAPYTLAQTGTFKHSDGFTVHLVQLVSPARGARCTDAFSQGDFMEGELLGFPTFWMEFEHFATLFEKSCALVWPHYDPVTVHLQSQTLPGSSQHSLDSCEFPRNTAFLLRNESPVEHEVRILIRGTESSDIRKKPLICFLAYRAAGDTSKRYAVSLKNKLFSSCVATGREEEFLFTLIPAETIQLMVSASDRFAFDMTVTTIGHVQFSVIPENVRCCVSEGSWRPMFRNRRLPQRVLSFTNSSSNAITEVIVALEQKRTEKPPFPISVVGWLNVSPKRITRELEPEFHTETQSDYMAVWRISKTVRPDETITLLPCCFDDWCESSFRFAIYSQYELKPCAEDSTRW